MANSTYQCLLLSIKISLNAAQHLVTETSTAVIVTTSRMSSTARNIQSGCDHSKARAVACITAAPFEEFLAAEFPGGQPLQPLQRVSGSQQLVRESDRNVLILHSSGTTGGYESHDLGVSKCS